MRKTVDKKYVYEKMREMTNTSVNIKIQFSSNKMADSKPLHLYLQNFFICFFLVETLFLKICVVCIEIIFIHLFTILFIDLLFVFEFMKLLMYLFINLFIHLWWRKKSFNKNFWLKLYEIKFNYFFIFVDWSTT